MSSSRDILPSTCPYATTDGTPHDVRLRGLCSINGGADAPCETTELAIDRLKVTCAVAAEVGAKIMFSFPEFGLLEATVGATFAGGLEACFEPSVDSKLALYLAWQQDRSCADEDKAPAPRIVPVKKIVTLASEGEPECMARIIDLSRSGVSVTTTKELAPRQAIMVGPRPGHVVRVFEGGAALAFDEPIDRNDFDPTIALHIPA